MKSICMAMMTIKEPEMRVPAVAQEKRHTGIFRTQENFRRTKRGINRKRARVLCAVIKYTGIGRTREKC